MYALLDVVVPALRALGDSWAVLILGAIFGVAFVPIYGLVSPQRSIKSIKRQISGAILESVIFRAEPLISLKAQGRLFLSGIGYFCLAIPPILILLIPCVIVLAHLNPYFGYEPLTIGKPFVVSIGTSEAALRREGQAPVLVVDSHSSIVSQVLVTGPIRAFGIAERDGEHFGEATYRVVPGRITQGGDSADGAVADPLLENLPKSLQKKRSDIELHVSTKGSASELTIPVPVQSSIETKRIHPYISRSWFDWLLYPTPFELPDEITNVSLGFKEREVSFLGGSIHWVILFVIASIGAGFIASKAFKVEV